MNDTEVIEAEIEQEFLKLTESKLLSCKDSVVVKPAKKFFGLRLTAQSSSLQLKPVDSFTDVALTAKFKNDHIDSAKLCFTNESGMHIIDAGLVDPPALICSSAADQEGQPISSKQDIFYLAFKRILGK